MHIKVSPTGKQMKLNQSREILHGGHSVSGYCSENSMVFVQVSREELYKYFSSVFGGLGLFGNLVSIVVLLSKDMRSNCFNNILTALNITDSLHIVFAILEVLRVDFNGVYNYFLPHSFFPYFHYPAYRICLCASIYLIMAGGRS